MQIVIPLEENLIVEGAPSLEFLAITGFALISSRIYSRIGDESNSESPITALGSRPKVSFIYLKFWIAKVLP